MRCKSSACHRSLLWGDVDGTWRCHIFSIQSRAAFSGQILVTGGWAGWRCSSSRMHRGARAGFAPAEPVAQTHWLHWSECSWQQSLGCPWARGAETAVTVCCGCSIPGQQWQPVKAPQPEPAKCSISLNASTHASE